jgi:hypothetical protein
VGIKKGVATPKISLDKTVDHGHQSKSNAQSRRAERRKAQRIQASLEKSKGKGKAVEIPAEKSDKVETATTPVIEESDVRKYATILRKDLMERRNSEEDHRAEIVIVDGKKVTQYTPKGEILKLSIQTLDRAFGYDRKKHVAAYKAAKAAALAAGLPKPAESDIPPDQYMV